jgi:hypothetical protein
VARDRLSGEVLLARSLLSVTAEDLAPLREPEAEIGPSLPTDAAEFSGDGRVQPLSARSRSLSHRAGAEGQPALPAYLFSVSGQVQQVPARPSPAQRSHNLTGFALIGLNGEARN